MGSLELLFNPTGMVRSFAAGFSDLIYLPYYGLQRGPGAFVTGISQGMNSVVRNVTEGKWYRPSISITILFIFCFIWVFSTRALGSLSFCTLVGES